MNPAQEADEPADAVLHWYDALATDVRDALAELRRLVREVRADWTDPAGERWAQEAEALARDLARHEVTAGDLARRAAFAAADTGPGPADEPAGGTGPLLGDTAGSRADGRVGPVVPLLPDR